MSNCCKPCGSHPLLLNQRSDSLLVHLRKLAALPPWGEPLREPFIINVFHYAVYPAEGKSLFNSIVIRNSRLAGCFSVIDKPDFILLFVILCKPGVPCLPVGCIKSFSDLHE